MKLILPVAGASSRYPGMKPKWLLGHPSGNLMFREALSGLDLAAVDEVIIVCRSDHVDAFQADRVVERQLAVAPLGVGHRLVVIEPTRSQAETVALACTGISGPVFVKDVDGWFRHAPAPENAVVTMPVGLAPNIDPASKSYAVADETGRVLRIAEKQVISDSFCVGGYGFADASELVSAYMRLEPSVTDRELHLSDVIALLIEDGAEFVDRPTPAFLDWGTLDDWMAFQRRWATLFIDLDGTIVESSGPFIDPLWGETGALPGAVEACNRLHARGTVRVILTTSRPDSARELTEAQLARIGLRYDQIVFGLPHAQRILVNDFGATNPYPSAVSINLSRNSLDLADQLDSLLPETAQRER